MQSRYASRLTCAMLTWYLPVTLLLPLHGRQHRKCGSDIELTLVHCAQLNATRGFFRFAFSCAFSAGSAWAPSPLLSAAVSCPSPPKPLALGLIVPFEMLPTGNDRGVTDGVLLLLAIPEVPLGDMALPGLELSDMLDPDGRLAMLGRPWAAL